MPVTVAVNGMTVVHKDSGGTVSFMPDVCLTPGPPGRLCPSVPQHGDVSGHQPGHLDRDLRWQSRHGARLVLRPKHGRRSRLGGRCGQRCHQGHGGIIAYSST